MNSGGHQKSPETVEWMRKHLLALIRAAQEKGLLRYECCQCALIGNPENFDDHCQCGGRCVPMFADKSEPATSNYVELLKRVRELEEKLCEIQKESNSF